MRKYPVPGIFLKHRLSQIPTHEHQMHPLSHPIAAHCSPKQLPSTSTHRPQAYPPHFHLMQLRRLDLPGSCSDATLLQLLIKVCLEANDASSENILRIAECLTMDDPSRRLPPSAEYIYAVDLADTDEVHGTQPIHMHCDNCFWDRSSRYK